MSNDKALTLEADAVAVIRKMLLVGLASYGELMRLENAAEVQKLAGNAVDQSLIPDDITGSADTVGDFANALRLLG